MAEMTKELAVQMGDELMEAAREIARKYGYEVKRGGGRYETGESGKYKLNNIEFFKRGESGGNRSVQEDRALKVDFDIRKNMNGLGSVNVGDTYMEGSVEYEVVGWKARNRKYPVLVRNKSNGKTYKTTAGALRLNMGL